MNRSRRRCAAYGYSATSGSLSRICERRARRSHQLNRSRFQCLVAAEPLGGRATRLERDGLGHFEFVRVSDRSSRTALGIPPRRFFGLFERLVEELKPAGHGRQQRKSGGGIPTRTPSSLDRHRAAEPGGRSPQTTPPRRPHRRANQGSRSAPRRALRVLQLRAEAPPRAIPWRPYLEDYHVGIDAGSVRLEPWEDVKRRVD